MTHFEHRPMIMENQGLTGHESFGSPERARLGTSMALAWGVNRLIPRYFEYAPEHLQYPPSWFPAQPSWPYFHHYADAARRARFMNAQGHHDAAIAVYQPRESALAASAGVFYEGDRSLLNWHNAVDETPDHYPARQLELARHGFDYRVVDRHYLTWAELDGASFTIGGERFRVLVLPPMSVIASDTAAQIRRFAAAAEIVMAVGRVPTSLDRVTLRHHAARLHALFMNRFDYTVQIEVPAMVRADFEPLIAVLDKAAPPAVTMIGALRENLFFSRRFQGGTHWYWAVNDSGAPHPVMVRFAPAVSYERWGAETGERAALRAHDGQITLHFEPWDGCFVVARSEPSAAPLEPRARDRHVVTELPATGWTFTPESNMRLPYAVRTGTDELVWLAPERSAERGWWIAGPYPYGDHTGFFDVLPPERRIDTHESVWHWFESPTPSVHTPTGDDVYYAYVNAWSDRARTAHAAVDVNDSIRVWWNGQLVVSQHTHPPFLHLRDAWALRPAVTLTVGWNSVLLKIGPSLCEPTGFLFRLTDEQGATLRDVVYAHERTDPPASTPRPVHLMITTPPGTAGPGGVFDDGERRMPERAIEITPRAAPYRLDTWTSSALAWCSGTTLYETTSPLDKRDSHTRLLLDLRAVGVAAEAWGNDVPVGSRAWRPFVFGISARYTWASTSSEYGWPIRTPDGCLRVNPFTATAAGRQISRPSVTVCARCARTAWKGPCGL